MKKNKIIVFVLFLCVFCLVFVGCTKTETDLGVEKTVTVIIGEENYSVTTGAKYLFDLLNEMSQREENPIALNGSWSAYGIFITEVGNIKPTESNEYIEILTSDVNYQDVTEYANTATYDGVTVTTASLGVSSLPLQNGCTYVLKISAF